MENTLEKELLSCLLYICNHENYDMKIMTTYMTIYIYIYILNIVYIVYVYTIYSIYSIHILYIINFDYAAAMFNLFLYFYEKKSLPDAKGLTYFRRRKFEQSFEICISRCFKDHGCDLERNLKEVILLSCS